MAQFLSNASKSVSGRLCRRTQCQMGFADALHCCVLGHNAFARGLASNCLQQSRIASEAVHICVTLDHASRMQRRACCWDTSFTLLMHTLTCRCLDKQTRCIDHQLIPRRSAGTLADILSPSRLVIFGTLLTTLNKPMFAASGYVFATFGTVSTLYWITAAKARMPPPPS